MFDLAIPFSFAIDDIARMLSRTEPPLAQFILAKRKRFSRLMHLHYADAKKSTAPSVSKIRKGYQRFIRDYARTAAPQPINSGIYIQLIARMVHDKVNLFVSHERIQEVSTINSSGYNLKKK